MVRKTTKEILAESFMELTATKPISKISIVDIVENCAMTKPTFYRYFKDKYDLILDAMKKAGEQLNAGKVAELTGLDRKAVDKAFAAMKKEGSIVSPIRCKWEPAEK